jgi:hypothetical protein
MWGGFFLDAGGEVYGEKGVRGVVKKSGGCREIGKKDGRPGCGLIGWE